MGVCTAGISKEGLLGAPVLVQAEEGVRGLRKQLSLTLGQRGTLRKCDHAFLSCSHLASPESELEMVGFCSCCLVPLCAPRMPSFDVTMCTQDAHAGTRDRLGQPWRLSEWSLPPLAPSFVGELTARE